MMAEVEKLNIFKLLSNEIVNMDEKPIEMEVLEVNRIGGSKVVIKLKPRQKINFEPGSTIDIEIGRDRRTFSIANSILEGDYILIATKIRSQFKKSLASLKKGEIVIAYGPFESEFKLVEEGRAYVFASKGIGVTAIRGMIMHLLLSKSEKPFIVFYEPDEDGIILFREDLEKVNAIYSKPSRDKIPFALEDTVFYISGEPRDVKELTRIVLNIGAKPGKIMVEAYSGYE
ncbi:MAG: FAD-dependent oxidoreductase [Sulfolobaceae archaeon]